MPNIWGLGWVEDTKVGTDVPNEILLHAAKYQGYTFYCFWILKGQPTGGEGVRLPPPDTHTCTHTHTHTHTHKQRLGLKALVETQNSHQDMW